MGNKLLVGRYELIEKIGEGGMAVVYKAKDRLLNRFVAIKILRPEFTKDNQFVDSFRKESQAAAGLQHPNIISIYDVGREGNIYYIVMELVNGKPLSTIIKEDAPLDYRRAIQIAKEVASALSLAHKNDIIHRDVKPHNIMITEDGTAKLGDFGIAKAVSDSTLTETSKIIGSVHYFSPEQARGAYVDERSDIYSLGIVLYEMLTGKVPYDGENPVQVALMHINDEITPPSRLVNGLPPQLEQLVMKATDKFQSNRFKSADEMLSELKHIEFVTNMVGESVFAANAAGGFRPNNQNSYNNPSDEYEDYEMDKKKRKSKDKKKNKKKPNKNKKLVILGVIIALLLVGGGIGAAKLFIFGKIDVPDVVELSYTEAKSKLEDAGFKVERGDRVYSDDIDKGKVARQDPEAHTKAKKGSIITLNISAGKETGAVPKLVGKFYDKDGIESYLKENGGFKLGEVTKEKSDKYEKGQIIRQDPTADAIKEKGTKVNIVVCSGKKTVKVTVPNLVGLTAAQAMNKLKSLGLNAVITPWISGDATKENQGKVSWQEFDPGTEIKKGSTINLRTYKVDPNENNKPEPDPEEDD